MKKLLLLLVLLAAPSFAQQGTLSTPETVTATKVIVAEIHIGRTAAQVDVHFLTAGDAQKRSTTVVIQQADLASFVLAVDTARMPGGGLNETGGVLRRRQYRVLGWIVDNSRLVDESGQVIAVTLVP
jgi:hypothetical protein